jgi:hypothetical protein
MHAASEDAALQVRAGISDSGVVTLQRVFLERSRGSSLSDVLFSPTQAASDADALSGR